MPQELGCGESRSPGGGVLEQHLEGGPLMVVGHRVAEGGPEPFNPITLGIVAGGVDEDEMLPLVL